MSVKIFLSYSWDNKLEADKIDNFLRDRGYFVQRDIRETSYKRNIKEFMKSIGESDFVIPLISHTFLRSHNCMFEILELTRNPDYKERVLQVILNDAKVFYPIDRAKYLEYWSNERSQLESILNSNIPENAKNELKKDVSDFKNIEKTIYDFTTFLGEEIAINLNQLEKTEFKTIIDYIEKKYKNPKPVNKNRAEVKPLIDYNIGEEHYGKIKLIFKFGYFVQIHSTNGYRDGILHKSKLETLNYDFKQLKRFIDVGDDIHVKISEINYETPAAKDTGGLGFVTTEIFEKILLEKIKSYLIKAKENKDEVINLSGFALKKLPNEISEIKTLKRIFLSRNQFNDMPIELDLLPNLKTVFCDFVPKRSIRFDYVIFK